MLPKSVRGVGYGYAADLHVPSPWVTAMGQLLLPILRADDGRSLPRTLEGA